MSHAGRTAQALVAYADVDGAGQPGTAEAPASAVLGGAAYRFVYAEGDGLALEEAVAPPATMPGWLQAFTDYNPLSSLADAARGLMLGGPVAHSVILRRGPVLS